MLLYWQDWQELGTAFTKLHFLLNLRIGWTSYLLHLNRLDILVRDKYSSLLELLVSYVINQVLWVLTQERIHNASFSGPGKLECFSLETLSSLVHCNTLVIGLIYKLQRKWSVVNMTPYSKEVYYAKYISYFYWLPNDTTTD